MVDAHDSPDAPAPSDARAALARAALRAWLLLATLNLIGMSLFVATPHAGWTVRALRHLVDMGHHLALGLLSAGAVLVWQRLAARVGRRGVVLAIYLGALAIGFALLRTDLAGLLRRAGEALEVTPSALRPLLVLGLALGPVAAVLLGSWLAHGWRRLGVALLILAGFAANNLASPMDNPGTHFFLAWCCALLATPSLRIHRSPADGRNTRRRRATLAIGLVLAGGWALAALLWTPTNSVRVDLTRWQSTVLAPFLYGGAGRQPISEAVVREAGRYFRDRRALPPTPPSDHAVLPERPIVLLLSVEAMRADVLSKPENARHVPRIAALAASGTVFHQARAGGSQTVYTLTALFKGTGYSQQYWSEFNGSLWPAEDVGAHFPTLLGDAGITTAFAPAARWLESPQGLLRGFAHGAYRVTEDKWTAAPVVADQVIALLDAHAEGPLFLFAHFFDSHHPYAHGEPGAPEFERYLDTLGFIDAQIGRIVDHLEAHGLGARSLLIVTADHGEAFGEHQSRLHASTLYDEVLRVPLVFRGPGVTVKNIDTPVSLTDLGPTLLDLFGQPSPGHYMGQSLVPLLRGQTLRFERPVVAETRLKRSIVFEDGIKVIHDARSGMLEVYDLSKDPGELHNLSDTLDDRLRRRVDQLRLFYRAHTLRRPGYAVPYRK